MTVKRDARGQHELRCPDLLPSRSLPARLQRLAPAARQKKKSGSTPWVVGACGTRAQPPAEASCGRLVRREASACAWLVVRLTCRARGASEAAPRTLGPCVMVGGAGGPPAEVRPWWWPERVSRVGARLRMPLEDSLASGRLSKPRRWLKLGGRAHRGWGVEAEFLRLHTHRRTTPQFTPSVLYTAATHQRQRMRRRDARPLTGRQGGAQDRGQRGHGRWRHPSEQQRSASRGSASRARAGRRWGSG